MKSSPLAQYTGQVRDGTDLAPTDITSVVEQLLDESIAHEIKADFLAALARKGETAGEIAAFAEALRAHAVDPAIDPARLGGIVLDVCGTGADMAHTFNISTCVTFVAAAAGIAVAKHGNRAITSKSGSADVLLALGANIELEPDTARRCLEEVGVAFFFAPRYHPAFKAIAPVRKLLAEQKQRTVFNILGPLVNPARPTHQVVGIFDKGLVKTYAEVLGLLGVKRAMVVHGDGLDEFTILGPNTVAELWGGRVELTERDGRAAHTEPRVMEPTLAELAGGDPADNAQIIRDILAGNDRGPRRDIVLLNAAAALVITEKADTFEQAWNLAGELVDSGAAREKLEKFVPASQG